jgi:deferrochelatase/peroxidase EfeB
MSGAAGASHAPPAAEALDLDDIQGVILRGYRRMLRARHLLLQVGRPAAFKAMLGDLATEDHASGPFVTVAADWEDKPPIGEQPSHCVNIGLTCSGLRALGVPAGALETFPQEFCDGAVLRAAHVGDTGASDPARWIGPLTPERHDSVHAVLSLYALDDEILDDLTAQLRARAARDGAAVELACRDASALWDDDRRSGFVHFGYRDGLSQPTIDGVSRPAGDGIRDPLAPVPPGDFVLGHPSQREGCYRVPEPAALGRNGSFAALRILEQDVQGFERFLSAASDGTDEGRELLAARLCGRWRSGVPLVMSPASGSAQPEIPESELNAFDFATEHPDAEGRLCPLGSHIRRVNPRRQPGTPGGDAEKRRLIRRGLPYGPPYDPAHPGDGHERGLIGLFICVSLRDQFEFVMRKWINDGSGAGGLGRTRDPLTGNNDPTGEFTAAGTPPVTELPSFVTTRGGAYCFLPSMTALRYLAEL